MRKQTIIMASLVGGFIGGLASHYVFPATAQAQVRNIPQQIWAHEFVVADATGEALEAIGIEKDGRPSTEFVRRDGQVQAIRFNIGLNSIYVGAGPRHPTLLPTKPFGADQK
jgi:hypothetical protein